MKNIYRNTTLALAGITVVLSLVGFRPTQHLLPAAAKAEVSQVVAAIR